MFKNLFKKSEPPKFSDALREALRREVSRIPSDLQRRICEEETVEVESGVIFLDDLRTTDHVQKTLEWMMQDLVVKIGHRGLLPIRAFMVEKGSSLIVFQVLCLKLK